ncbi:MAG TPA: hypothetical protein VF711_07565 [Acidimicrobiales bacterium]
MEDIGERGAQFRRGVEVELPLERHDRVGRIGLDHHSQLSRWQRKLSALNRRRTGPGPGLGGLMNGHVVEHP